MPFVMPPCTTTPEYEVTPASVAADACDQLTSAGLCTSISTLPMTYSPYPPSRETPGASVAFTACATSSPTANSVTPSPTSSTMPVTS